jgi:hypothetical protein
VLSSMLLHHSHCSLLPHHLCCSLTHHPHCGCSPCPTTCAASPLALLWKATQSCSQMARTSATPAAAKNERRERGAGEPTQALRLSPPSPPSPPGAEVWAGPIQPAQFQPHKLTTSVPLLNLTSRTLDRNSGRSGPGALTKQPYALDLMARPMKQRGNPGSKEASRSVSKTPSSLRSSTLERA